MYNGICAGFRISIIFSSYEIQVMFVKSSPLQLIWQSNYGSSHCSLGELILPYIYSWKLDWGCSLRLALGGLCRILFRSEWLKCSANKLKKGLEVAVKCFFFLNGPQNVWASGWRSQWATQLLKATDQECRWKSVTFTGILKVPYLCFWLCMITAHVLCNVEQYPGYEWHRKCKEYVGMWILIIIHRKYPENVMLGYLEHAVVPRNRMVISKSNQVIIIIKTQRHRKASFT